MRHVLRFGSQALATAVVLLAGAALVAGVLVPRLAGATPYAVASGSMEPTLPIGALAVVRPSESVALGDVITFQLRSGEPEVATHRVVGLGFTTDGEPRYTTRGDANEISDRVAVAPEQLRGKLWYSVPYLGYVSALLSGQDRQWLAVAAAVLLGAYAAWQVVAARREHGRRERGRHLRQQDEPSHPAAAGTRAGAGTS